MRFSLRAVLSCSFLASIASAISPITRRGRYLYTEDGNRFYIKGIAYQEQGAVIPGDGNDFQEPSTFYDPLADEAACIRDVNRLRELSVNTIRVYSVDSALNHDACMKALSDAGIYTIIDLSLPLNGSIDRLQPTWTANLLNQYIRTIDVFDGYDNVLAYNVGNEIATSEVNNVAQYIKAAARDIKAYLASTASTSLVAYASIDGAPAFRIAQSDFLTCDLDGKNSGATAVDLYGLNNYEWCGTGNMGAYEAINEDFKDLSVVAYFSEYGCVRQPPRLWSEVAVLFGPEMSKIWSGGIAFSYFPAESADGQFGMVTVSEDGRTVDTGEDYNRLRMQYANVTFVNEPNRDGAGDSSYGACPDTNKELTIVKKLPPTPNHFACDCLSKILSCRFTPATQNYSVILGDLMGQACGLLSQNGADCLDIASDNNGNYGRLSTCDPTIKLSFVMSKFYENQNRDYRSCLFGGNGTINSLAPTSAAAADAAASSCNPDPEAVFTPSYPSDTNPTPGQMPPQTDVPDNSALPALTASALVVSLLAVLGSGAWIFMLA